MDLATLDLATQAETPRTMQVVHPLTSLPIDGMTITLIGAESNTARDLQRRAQRARTKQAMQKRMDPEEIEAQAVRFLAALIKGWENIDWQGAPLAWSFENAVMLLTTLPWLRKQVDEFAYNAEEFAQGN